MVWVGSSFHILGGEVRTEKRLMVAFTAQLNFLCGCLSQVPGCNKFLEPSSANIVMFVTQMWSEPHYI